MVLNENELLYPYRKWMLRVVESAPKKPDHDADRVQALLTSHSPENVAAICDETLAFASCEPASIDWPNIFMKDSEHNWMEHEAPIDDV